MKPLEGRNAIITGASQGLGKAIAEHYLRAGANVLLCARVARSHNRVLPRPARLVPALEFDDDDGR